MSRLLARTTIRAGARMMSRGGGGGAGGPMMPPFARLRPPTSSIPENVELVWDDSVAPETSIDFDAPHVSSGEAVFMFVMGFSLFYGFYKLVAGTEPVEKNPVAIRDYALPNDASIEYMGYHSSVVEKMKAKRMKELGVKEV